MRHRRLLAASCLRGNRQPGEGRAVVVGRVAVDAVDVLRSMAPPEPPRPLPCGAYSITMVGPVTRK